MNPKVSVILSFYNAERTIERAVRDILDQTYRDFEFILIDDGSTDGGTQIVEKLAAEDDRIRLIRKPNTGVSDSRNIGLDAAKGEWVYFVDGDDWVELDALETLIGGTADPSCDLVVSDFYRVQGEKMAYKKGPASGLISREQFAKYMAHRPANYYYSSLWNKLFKRAIIEFHHMRFDIKMQFGEDHVFILEYLGMINSVMLINKALYFYVDNEGSLVHQGLNPVGVVKMKYNTFFPYMRLYRKLKVFTKPHQRPLLYSFIFMSSTDCYARKGAVPTSGPRDGM